MRDTFSRGSISRWCGFVAGLSATFATAGRRLLAAPPLLRRVLRRRPVRVRRILIELRFQIGDPLHQLGDRCLQLGDALDVTRISRHPLRVPQTIEWNADLEATAKIDLTQQ